jgi:hypothetical protein
MKVKVEEEDFIFKNASPLQLSLMHRLEVLG